MKISTWSVSWSQSTDLLRKESISRRPSQNLILFNTSDSNTLLHWIPLMERLLRHLLGVSLDPHNLLIPLNIRLNIVHLSLLNFQIHPRFWQNLLQLISLECKLLTASFFLSILLVEHELWLFDFLDLGSVTLLDYIELDNLLTSLMKTLFEW